MWEKICDKQTNKNLLNGSYVKILPSGSNAFKAQKNYGLNHFAVKTIQVKWNVWYFLLLWYAIENTFF